MNSKSGFIFVEVNPDEYNLSLKANFSLVPISAFGNVTSVTGSKQKTEPYLFIEQRISEEK